MSDFCHLHVHNEFSLLDGIGTSGQYAAIAKELGQDYLALTNHGNVDGAISHQKACSAAGVKPIHGCELYLVENITVKQKGEKRYHITVLVKNDIGWTNLLKILTIANVEGFYYRPRIDVKSLLGHVEGLVFLTGCSMSFLNMKPGGLSLFRDLLSIAGKRNVFLEIMPHNIDEQKSLNARAVKLSKRYEVGLVATNDCHYLNNRSSYYQEVLLAIQSKKKMSDKDRWKFNVDGLYLRSRDEMWAAFNEQNVVEPIDIATALDNTTVVAELCKDFSIKKIEPNLPCIGLKDGQTDIDKLNELIDEGYEKRLPFVKETWILTACYNNRIDEELELIKKMKFERYFLIVWDLINWCKQNDIMTGPGRGSVGGSLVAYLIGITDVDPIKYDLVFSRFISADRIDLPDIDMDFEDHKRHLVKKYLQDKYGEYNVAGLTTFMTMKGRGVLRDISRTFEIPLPIFDAAAKAVIDSDEDNCQIRDSCESVDECKKFKRRYPEVIEIAEALEGQKRGVGQHAAAVCVSTVDLRSGLNCNLAIRSKEIVANWDKNDAEFMGLVKLDILGLSALSMLNETRKLVLKNYNETIDFNSIPLDDQDVYEEIQKGNTIGAFQIGARGLSKFCVEMEVDSFDFIVAATALYRPGPLHSGMAEEFVKIKKGKKKVKKIHPVYDEITKNTLGIIVYQEQVMSVINQLSGIDMTTCDKIRKLMAKSKGEEAINKYKDQFLSGCGRLKTIDKKAATALWKTILTFGKYGFNKAHSVEYSLITYWDMWLKIYYPHEFIASCLTFGSKEMYSEYMHEARRLGLTVRLPKIGISDAFKWMVDTNKNLFAPFAAVKGIGDATAPLIAEYKTGDKKRGFFQLGKPSGKIPGVNKTAIEMLEKMNSFSKEIEIVQTIQEKRLIKELLA